MEEGALDRAGGRVLLQAMACPASAQEDYGELRGHLWPRQAERKAGVPGTLWVALITPSPRGHFCFLSPSFWSDEKGMASPFSSPFMRLSLGPFQELLGNVIEGEGLKVASGPTSRKCL